MATASQSAPTQRGETHEDLPKPVLNGKRCDEIIREFRRVRQLCLGGGKTIAEVQKELPTLNIWELRETLSAEDREVLNHPNRWGPVGGYARGLLAKEYGKSTETIADWVKAYRRWTKEQEKLGR